MKYGQIFVRCALPVIVPVHIRQSYWGSRLRIYTARLCLSNLRPVSTVEDVRLSVRLGRFARFLVRI